MGKYVITLDQGTTSSRAIVFDSTGSIVGLERKEHRQIYPRPGWVEHDPEEIRENQAEVLRSVVEKCQIPADDILALGITNQRETIILWDKIQANRFITQLYGSAEERRIYAIR